MTIHNFNLEAWKVEFKISQRFSWVPVLLNNKKVYWFRSYWIVHSHYKYNKAKESKQFSRVIFAGQSLEECKEQFSQIK